jgi:pyridinium-3,5-biscarboxylic acid mononucleotide sulfurtransferase
MAQVSSILVGKRDELLRKIRAYGSCAIAFSGGVDSAVVAKAAQLALGDAAVVVTGTSEALAEGELELARSFAESNGMRHVLVDTNELGNPDYVANGPDRCYHCKSNLYEKLRAVARQLGVTVVVNGANVDDLTDYRPGQKAAAENGVMSPLAECGFTKRDVRDLAREWNLPLANKPATPCLSSRIAYGQKVLPERLLMVDRAEQYLRSLGLGELRVRFHGDDLARIEVHPDLLNQLCEPHIRVAIAEEFAQIGFKFVTLDLVGFRSGSFQALVPTESLKHFASR